MEAPGSMKAQRLEWMDGGLDDRHGGWKFTSELSELLSNFVEFDWSVDLGSFCRSVAGFGWRSHQVGKGDSMWSPLV